MTIGYLLMSLPSPSFQPPHILGIRRCVEVDLFIGSQSDYSHKRKRFASATEKGQPSLFNEEEIEEDKTLL
jgi:hypothetical protein